MYNMDNLTLWFQISQNTEKRLNLVILCNLTLFNVPSGTFPNLFQHLNVLQVFN